MATFFKQAILVDLIRVQSLGLIIAAFSLVQSTKLNKELQFRIQFKLQIPALIISAIAAVLFAYLGFGVWSLVAKELIYTLQKEWLQDYYIMGLCENNTTALKAYGDASGGGKVNYTYDSDGYPLTLTSPDIEITFTYK